MVQRNLAIFVFRPSTLKHQYLPSSLHGITNQKMNIDTYFNELNIFLLKVRAPEAQAAKVARHYFSFLLLVLVMDVFENLSLWSVDTSIGDVKR
jgi:hypothetical protein